MATSIVPGLGIFLNYILLQSVPEIRNQGAVFDLPTSPSLMCAFTCSSLLLCSENQRYQVPTHYGCFD